MKTNTIRMIAAALLVVVLGSVAYLPGNASNRTKEGEEEVLASDNNTVLLSDEVNDETMARLLKEILQKDAKLKSGEPIYIILNTPGGSVSAGEDLIEALNKLNRPIHTITLYAASMGSNISNRLGKRLSHPNGLYMYHRMRSFSYGQVPGEYNTDVEQTLAMADRLDNTNATRMKLSLSDYRAKVINEYYTRGKQAVAENSADAVAVIKCDAALINKEITQKFYFWGLEIVIKYSGCPSIIGPISVEITEETVVEGKDGKPSTIRKRVGRDALKSAAPLIEAKFGRNSPTTNAILNGGGKVF
jgi:ATP-dependent Clp protease protease subunit